LAVRGVLAVVLVCLALAGCHREAKDAFVDTRTPPSLSPRYFPPEGWAWGTVQAEGGSSIRYGVAAPTGVPKASVIIAAAAGEPAELYYETARDLIGQGYTVWVLDPAPSPSAGAAAIHALIDNMVRPKAADTVVLAGYDYGALESLLEAETLTPRVNGLVVWQPRLTEPLGLVAAGKVKVGLGGFTAEGEHAWTRPDYDLSGRATLAQAWQTANPDLRPKPRPWSWFDNAAVAADQAADPARLKLLSVPVLVVSAPGDAPADKLCAGLARCQRTAADPGGKAPLHLAADAQRTVWLQALLQFVEARVAEHAHGV
jgi:lysophospholipase